MSGYVFNMWMFKYKYATEDKNPGVVLSHKKPIEYGDVFIPHDNDKLLVSTNKKMMDKMQLLSKVKVNITIMK